MVMGSGCAREKRPLRTLLLLGDSEGSMIFRTMDSAKQPGNVTEEALEVDPIHKHWGTWAVACYLI